MGSVAALFPLGADVGTFVVLVAFVTACNTAAVTFTAGLAIPPGGRRRPLGFVLMAIWTSAGRQARRSRKGDELCCFLSPAALRQAQDVLVGAAPLSNQSLPGGPIMAAAAGRPRSCRLGVGSCCWRRQVISVLGAPPPTTAHCSRRRASRAPSLLQKDSSWQATTARPSFSVPPAAHEPAARSAAARD